MKRWANPLVRFSSFKCSASRDIDDFNWYFIDLFCVWIIKIVRENSQDVIHCCKLWKWFHFLIVVGLMLYSLTLNVYVDIPGPVLQAAHCWSKVNFMKKANVCVCLVMTRRIQRKGLVQFMWWPHISESATNSCLLKKCEGNIFYETFKLHTWI